MFHRATLISTKMTMLACGSAALALLLAGGVWGWRSGVALRDAKREQLRTRTEVVALQLASSLAARSLSNVQQRLDAFASDATIEGVRLVGTDGQVLATWGPTDWPSTSATNPAGRSAGWSAIEVTCDVVSGSRHLGTLHVRANTSDLQEQMAAWARTGAEIAAIAMSVVLLLVVPMQRAVSLPLSELAEAARQVLRGSGPEIRLRRRASGEMKTLQDAFHHLLERVRTSELVAEETQYRLEAAAITRNTELSRETRRRHDTESELAAAHETVQIAATLGEQIERSLDDLQRAVDSALNDTTRLPADEHSEALLIIRQQFQHLSELTISLRDVSGERSSSAASASDAGGMGDAGSRAAQLGPAGAPSATAGHGPPKAGTGSPAKLSTEAPRRVAGPLGGKQILVVDDGEVNRRSLETMLRAAGAEVLTARDGFQAIHAAQRTDLDLILMDSQMPVLDGCSATRELRSKGFVMPIIGLLAEPTSGDAARCVEAGCNGWLTKPIDARLLIETITRALVAMPEANKASAAL